MLHPKSVLIERCKALGLSRPTFQTTRTGPDHEPTFVSDVVINDEVYGTGQGSNKRDAERRACEEAIRHLDARTPPDSSASPSHRAESEATTMKKHPPSEEYTDDQASLDNGDFEGPWPIFPEVLAASLMVANSRIDPVLRGEEASHAVQMTALQLYKGCLAQLGEVVEVEES